MTYPTSVENDPKPTWLERLRGHAVDVILFAAPMVLEGL
jgi:hypothetical protein